MRVIAGECKGRPLKAVPGTNTRPTTDKIKESIFNMIGPYFEGGIALDLYGGSGGLGIEALSRGIDRVIFTDKDAKAIQTIKQNLQQCRYTEKAEIYRNDAHRALKALYKKEAKFDLIFLDPPYAKQKIASDIETIGEFELLSKNGMIVVEHDAQTDLPDFIHSFVNIRKESYGSTTTISLYQWKNELLNEVETECQG